MNKPGFTNCLCLILLSSIFLLGGCKALKTDKGKVEVNNINSVIKGVNKSEPQYNWLNGRVKISINTPKRNMSGRGHIKIKKDSLIWLTISPALGIEVMRVQITPDSVYVLDRINQKYSVFPFRMLNNYLNTASREFEFENLTNMLTGQPMFSVNKDYKLKLDSTSIQLTFENKVFKEEINLVPKTLKTQKYHLVKPATGQALTIDYKEYKKVKDYILPYGIDILAKNPREFGANIQFKELYFKKQSQVSFTVPSSYEKVQ